MTDITRIAVKCAPVITNALGGHEWTLRSPWWIESQLEPVYWGEGDMLMLSGDYKDPIRGFRYRAKLTTQAIDLNDLGILNEYRRASEPLVFYPWGKDRPGWGVYIPTAMYHLRRASPETASYEIEMLGTSILSVEDTKTLAIIIEAEVSVEGTGPWSITATWLPMITAGNITLTVSDIGGHTDNGTAPIATGKVSFTTQNLTSNPVRATFTHSLSPYKKEVNL